jgi:hypothetical protein
MRCVRITYSTCTGIPDTCTGHVTLAPCQYSVKTEAQLYWNNIDGLSSDGPLQPSNNYEPASLEQIWRAANATRSHVLIDAAQPSDVITIEFAQTDFEFQMVIMPSPSTECFANRVGTAAKCSENKMHRVGKKEGSCGDDVERLTRLIASSIQQHTYEQNEADRSAASDYLQKFKFRIST